MNASRRLGAVRRQLACEPAGGGAGDRALLLFDSEDGHLKIVSMNSPAAPPSSKAGLQLGRCV